MEFFLKTGKFDYLEIGQTKDWILNNFPDPEDWSSNSSGIMGADIWKYGHIELHFSNDKLTTIFSDHFNFVSVNVDSHKVEFEEITAILDGGKSLEIKPWIVDSELTIADAITTLLTENIDFNVETNPFNLDDHFINITLKSGVTLSFQGNKNKPVNHCTLGAFSYSGNKT